MNKEESCLVTNDRWLREKGGQLDTTDRELLDEASQNSQYSVRVINMEQMLEAMKQSEPEKFREFKKGVEEQAGKSLTYEELVELSGKANERLIDFRGIVLKMDSGQALQVHNWRVDQKMTWRRVAREAYNEDWFERDWYPPSNQIMGMALCEKAAGLFLEDYQKPPWN